MPSMSFNSKTEVWARGAIIQPSNVRNRKQALIADIIVEYRPHLPRHPGKLDTLTTMVGEPQASYNTVVDIQRAGADNRYLYPVHQPSKATHLRPRAFHIRNRHPPPW
eukprot:7932726-Pyramimonas_sp.AAC.1